MLTDLTRIHNKGNLEQNYNFGFKADELHNNWSFFFFSSIAFIVGLQKILLKIEFQCSIDLRNLQNRVKFEKNPLSIKLKLNQVYLLVRDTRIIILCPYQRTRYFMFHLQCSVLVCIFHQFNLNIQASEAFKIYGVIQPSILLNI